MAFTSLLTLAVLVVGTPGDATAASAATSAPPAVRALEDAQGTPGVHADFMVDAPADVVLELLWDVGRFKQIFPDIKELAVVARHAPDDIEVKFFVDAVVMKPTYTLRRRLAADKREIRWEQTTGDLKRIIGRWQVSPTTATTSRVTYESYVDVGVVGVSGIYRAGVLRKVDEMVGRVRRASVTLAAARVRPVPGEVPGARTATRDVAIPGG